MKTIVQLFAFALAAAMVQLFLPWWSIAVVGVVIGYVFDNTPGWAFLAGLLAIGLLWLTYAGWLDVQNNALLSGKVAQLFPSAKMGMLYLLTALAGGVTGGFATMTGALLQKALKKG
jgi:uncharacterized membrane protein (Fun14 family)